LEESDVPLAEIAETEFLLCSLRDWHGDGDVVDHYALEGVEATIGGRGGVIRPFGTWNKLLKRARER